MFALVEYIVTGWFHFPSLITLNSVADWGGGRWLTDQAVGVFALVEFITTGNHVPRNFDVIKGTQKFGVTHLYAHELISQTRNPRTNHKYSLSTKFYGVYFVHTRAV